MLGQEQLRVTGLASCWELWEVVCHKSQSVSFWNIDPPLPPALVEAAPKGLHSSVLPYCLLTTCNHWGQPEHVLRKEPQARALRSSGLMESADGVGM